MQKYFNLNGIQTHDTLPSTRQQIVKGLSSVENNLSIK